MRTTAYATAAQASVLCLEATPYKCTFSDISKLHSQTVCTVLIPDHYILLCKHSTETNGKISPFQDIHC